MKQITLIILATVFFPIAHAAQEAVSMSNLNAGRWSLTGNGSFSGGDANYVRNTNIGLDLEYFAMNKLSVGLKSGLVAKNGTTGTVEIGPSLTYYVWTQNQFAGLLNTAYLFDKQNGSYVQINLGADYLATNWLAFGTNLLFGIESSGTYIVWKLLHVKFFL
jgi:hypothetical protein